MPSLYGFLSKLHELLTFKRLALFFLGVLVGVLSWIDYLLIYYFESPLGAAVHFFLRDLYMSHSLQEVFQGVAPLLIFILASISGGLIDGIMITGLSSLVFTFGKQTQLRTILLSLSYQPRFGWEYGIVVTLVVAGIVGGFFSQFQVYSIIWKDISSSLRDLKVVAPFALISAAPLIAGKCANITYISPTRMIFLNWYISSNEALVTSFVYVLLLSPLPSFLSKRFWSGAIIGGVIGLSSFIGFLGLGVERVVHDLIWLPYYVSVEGGITSSYLVTTTMSALFITISLLWGGFWASAGRISTYTSPPVEITEPHMKAYIFRDLWSNFFLHGKNVVDEFREKIDRSLLGKLKRILGTKTYITYEKMDRVPRGELPPMPEPELEIIPLEGNKCKIRVLKTGEILGPFINPDYLEQKYEPIWNPFARTFQANMVKAFIPVLLLIIAFASLFFYLSISPWLSLWASPTHTFLMTGETWLLITSSLLFLIILISFVTYWVRKASPSLTTRPEGAPAIFTVGLFAGALFVFLEYFIIHLAEFLNMNIVASPYMILFGLTPEQWIKNWLSLFEYNTTLILFAYNRVFSACLYGATFLAIAALLIGLSGVQVMGLERYNLYFYADSGPLFPYKNRHDAPVWLEGNYYWVMRHIYLWPGEFTLSSRALYAVDYERVELWVNAETGVLEWVVSDYHWRELFYRIPPDGKEHLIIVDFNPNFHTPEITPIHPEDLPKYRAPEATKAIFIFVATSIRKLGRRAKELFKSIRIRLSSKEEEKFKKAFKRRVDFINNFLMDIGPGARKLCAHVAANLPWSFWRYPLGVRTINEASRKYLYREKGYYPPVLKSPLHPVRGSIDGEGLPAVEQLQICPNCSTIFQVKYDSKDPESWTCPSCKKDTRRFSPFH